MELFCETVAAPKARISSSISLENPTVGCSFHSRDHKASQSCLLFRLLTCVTRQASVSQFARDIDDLAPSDDEQPLAKKIKTASGAAKPSTTNEKTASGVGKSPARNDRTESGADATQNKTKVDPVTGASAKKMKAATSAGSSKKSKSVSSDHEAPAHKNEATSSADSSARKPKVLSASAVAGMMLPDNEVMHPTYRPPIRQQSSEREVFLPIHFSLSYQYRSLLSLLS
jgi:hypothetical protein